MKPQGTKGCPFLQRLRGCPDVVTVKDVPSRRKLAGARPSSWAATLRLAWGLAILTAPAAGQLPATISGFITDLESGEALMGANVIIKDSAVGTASNLDGYYVLGNLKPGRIALLVSYIGYAPADIEVSIRAGQAHRQDVELAPRILSAEAIEVLADREKFRRDIAISHVSLNPVRLRALPQVGEVDLFRAIQLLPGVRARSEFSSGLIVRGGNTDQNLILFDGITVYNPSHLGGFFSTFITEGLREAELVKGAYPAEFGGRLSSVLDIHSKDGNSKRLAGSAEISLVASKALLEGPLGKGGWLLTGRRTYVDQVLKALKDAEVIDFELPYYFFDVQGNIYQNLGTNDRLSLSLYMGSDDLDWPDILADISWGNRTISARWRHLFNSRLISTFLVADSRFETNFAFGGSGAADFHNRIKDLTATGDLTYFRSDHQSIKFGFEVKGLDIRYLASFGDLTTADIRQQPLQTALYYDDKWNFHQWVVRYGLRLNHNNQVENRLTVAPRFSIKHLVNTFSAVSLSMGRYYQYIFTINDEFNLQVINYWLAQDETQPLQYSDQVILGYEFQGRTYRLSLEGYAKTMNNLQVFRDTRVSFDDTTAASTTSDLFRPTDAVGWGAELFAQKTRGKLTGNVGYTLSWVVKQIEGEPKYWANWDRRHEIKMTGSWRFHPKWGLSATFQLGNGYPYTRMLGTYVYYEPGLVKDVTIEQLPGTRNNARLPDYHRLDVSLTRRLKGKRMRGEVYINIINIINIYNHRNVLYVFWDTDELVTGRPAVKNELKMFPIIPSFGIRFSF